MADISDVEKALVSTIASGLFSAAYSPGAYQSSVAGFTTKLYRGWPEAANLDADLLAGTVHASVFPLAMGRNTTRHEFQWQNLPYTAPTLTVSLAGPVVTFGGTAAVGQLVGVGVGTNSASYVVQAGDSPASVVAALAALLGSGWVASGATITAPTDAYLVARVVQFVTGRLETRLQEQHFSVSVWAPSPAARDATAGLTDNTLAQVQWIALPDGTSGHLIYRGTFTNDKPARDRTWQRDLRYSVEYPTTILQSQPQMLFGLLNSNGAYTADAADRLGSDVALYENGSLVIDQNGLPILLSS